MRILHTADWHIGRVLFGASLLEDQAAMLRQLVDVIRTSQPDLVIIAGDLYDRAVPPPDAVNLFDAHLTEVILDIGVPVAMISGNHDSAERLGFGARLLAKKGLHLVTDPERALTPLRILDEHGPVDVWLFPYVDAPFLKRSVVDVRGDESSSPDARRSRDAKTAAQALQLLVQRATRQFDASRNIAVAHGSVHGAATSDSERPIPLGASTPASTFAPFTYTALGHHHRAQDFLDGRARYPGSLLAYSFADASVERSVTLVDIDALGDVHREIIPLAPPHPLVVIEGTLAELLHNVNATAKNAYVKARLTDARPVLDPQLRLREAYPHLLVVEQTRLLPGPTSDTTTEKPALDDLSLFEAFHAEVAAGEFDDDDRRVLEHVIQRAVSLDEGARVSSGNERQRAFSLDEGDGT